MDPATPKNPPSHRLDSWKEIAAYFGCDERTVRRWEKDRGLPVHRLPGRSGGKVFAFADELARWQVPEKAEEGESRPEEVAAGGRWLWWVAAAVAVVVLAAGAWGWRAYEAQRGRERVAAHKPTAEAEDLYLKGRYYWNLRTADGLNHAVDSFTQAIVRDPQYAEAYVGLADSYNLLREYTTMPATEAYPRALAAAKKAVELDEGIADAHASLGFAEFYGNWNTAAAEREFRRAIELDPNNVNAHHWYANTLSATNRHAEALAEIERARKIAPDSKSVLADKGAILMVMRDTAGAVALLKQMEKAEPEFVSPHRYLAAAYLATGQYPQYLAEYRRTSELTHYDGGIAIAAAGEKGYQRAQGPGMLQAQLEAQQTLLDKGQISPYMLAQTCALMGRAEDAIHYLEMARDRHEEAFTFTAADPALVRLHGDARYEALVASLAHPAKQ